MAIILNDNLKINTGKPVDSKYLTTGNTVYESTTDVTGSTSPNLISVPERYTGLTVNILGEEWWFKEGVGDNDLIPKISNLASVSGITGATNLGFFSGLTGIQTLRMTTKPPLSTNYQGEYNSLFNYYYRDTSGVIRIGTPPIDGIPKRAYLKLTAPSASFVWNEKDDATDSYGWLLMDGDIRNLIGQAVVRIDYYGTTGAYTATTWNTGVGPNPEDRTLVINEIFGSLTTGTTKTEGAPVYAQTSLDGTTLELRILRSLTPQLTISYDETFIDLNTCVPFSLTGATNGLIVPSTGNTARVELGGELCRNTCIGGNDYNYNLSTHAIGTLTLDASCGILCNSANAMPFVYAGNYYACPSLSYYSPYSIPDLKTVTGVTQNLALIKPIHIVSGNSYTVQPNDFYIGTSGGSIITLPSTLPNGIIITIADICGNASCATPVQVNSDVGFFGALPASLAFVGTAYGSMSFIFICAIPRWGVIAFNPDLV